MTIRFFFQRIRNNFVCLGKTKFLQDFGQMHNLSHGINRNNFSKQGLSCFSIILTINKKMTLGPLDHDGELGQSQAFSMERDMLMKSLAQHLVFRHVKIL